MKLRIDLSKEYGLVLEGGGAKGAYQIGAWKALREEGIKIRGVAGTSVGSLNGALICMDDLEKAEEIWKTITYSRVLDVEDDLIDGLKKLDVKSLNFAEVISDAKRILTDKGLDITPLKKLIADTVDEEKIRKSPCEFYATTFSVTDRKEMNVDVKAVPEGTIKDVLLASAYFPGFKNEKLGGKTYLDGGSVNNVPVNVLTDRGYKDIIVLRIYGVGVDKAWLLNLPEDVHVYKIAPTRNLGGILEFDEKRARKNMLLGYYDAKRFLYGLSGKNYYFDMPNTEGYYFDKMMSELELLKLYLEPVMSRKDLDKLSGYRAFTEKIFPSLAKKYKLPPDWDYRDMYAALLESCAEKMKLDPYCIYTADEIAGKIQTALGSRESLLQAAAEDSGKENS